MPTDVTALNDLTETVAIKAVFKEYAKEVPIKRHQIDDRPLLGAAGSTEAIFSVLSISDGSFLPRSTMTNRIRNAIWSTFPTWQEKSLSRGHV